MKKRFLFATLLVLSTLVFSLNVQAQAKPHPTDTETVFPQWLSDFLVGWYAGEEWVNNCFYVPKKH